jgi:uroporphyrinogen decarboxylase
MGNAADALTSFYDAPEVALALIDKAVALSIEKGKAFIAAGVDGLMIGDSYTSGSVISPEIYLRFCAPAYREVAQEFHRLGVFCYKHCCGNYNPFLEHLPAIGVDAMDGIDPTSGMSVKHAKERIGERVTLLGGISCLTLLNGSPDEVYAEARRCVEAGKPGGRYILGSACAVPRFTPAANFAAARQAALDWGRY